MIWQKGAKFTDTEKSLILNLDRAPLNYVVVGNEMMTLGGAKTVLIEGSCITASLRHLRLRSMLSFYLFISFIRGNPKKCFKV